MNKGRVLAIDPGSKRIGVALSDERRLFAHPLETYTRRSLQRDVEYLQQLIDEHEVVLVVLGLPLHMNGKQGGATDVTLPLRTQLERQLTVPIIFWDERLTTKAAEQLLIEANMSRRKRKGVVDRVAAAILLQSYLDQTSRGENHVQPDGTEQDDLLPQHIEGN